MLVFTISSLIILRKLMSNDTTTSVYIYSCNTYVHLKCLHNISYNLCCFHFEFKWNQKVICCKRPSQTVTMKQSLLLHLFTIGVISAQSPGSCPDLRGIPDFKTLDYTGRWYEYASTSTNYSQGNDNSCVRALYSDYGNGVIGVFNEAIQ